MYTWQSIDFKNHPTLLYIQQKTKKRSVSAYVRISVFYIRQTDTKTALLKYIREKFKKLHFKWAIIVWYYTNILIFNFNET